MKKIVCYIYSMNKGGAERVLLTLMKEWRSQYEVVLITDAVSESEYELPQDIRRIVIGECTGRFGIGGLKRLYRLRKFLKQEKGDINLAFMLSGGVRACMATAFTNMPVVLAVRSDPFFDHPLEKERKRINSRVKRAKGIVCQTEVQKTFFDPKYQEKITVIPNPISAEFQNMKADGESEQRVVTVGRLYDYKNQELFIEAMARVIEKYPDYKAQIYGDGPYRDTLEKKIRSLHMKQHIFIEGESKNVAEDIKSARIFVLPSNTEGMPNALMEAMALGLPVISTDCPGGGPASLIKDGYNGMLCPIKDTDAMTQKLLCLIENKHVRKQLGQNAYKINETCNIDTISNRWLTFMKAAKRG